MKTIILAAGYGTRLHKDLMDDSREDFKHLRELPKALLPVGKLPLISHWVLALERRGDGQGIFVVTNDLYWSKFEEWAKQFKSVRVINDGTKSNEERLGAIACLQLVIDQFKIDDHILIIGGDTLFFEDFSLTDVVSEFRKLETENNESNLVLTYFCKAEETSKYGILEVDVKGKVTSMLEKPAPHETESRKACPCFYLLSKPCIPLVRVFLDEKKEAPVEQKDAPGIFISWLIRRKPVYAYHVSGRFDVGTLLTYIECDKYFQEKMNAWSDYLK